MKKPIILLIALILTACNAGPMTISPSPTVGETAKVMAQPSATELPEPSQIPASTPDLTIPTMAASEPEVTPIAKLSAGQKVEITSIHMFNPESGWALESTNHILHTSDGGNNWEDVTPQQGFSEKGGFFALDANTAWAAQDAAGNLILHTADSGRTWEAAQNPAGDALPMDLRLDLQFIDAQTGWYFGERSGHGIAHPNLASTIDGGKSWDMNRSFGTYGFYTDILVINKDTLYLSGGIWGDVRDNGNTFVSEYLDGKVTPSLEKTSDGGQTWRVIPLPRLDPIPDELKALDLPNNLMACRVDSVKFVHVYSQRIVASVSCQVGTVNGTQWFYGAFHYFTDDGEKWIAWQPTPEDDAVNDFINAQIGWRQITAGDKQSCHLQKTINAGQTWNTIKTTGWCSSQMDFIDEQTGWAIAKSVDAKSLVRTSDGGQTWEEIKPVVSASVSSQDSPNTIITELQMHDATSGWAFAYSTDNAIITDHYLRTVDGGKTWVDKTPKGVISLCADVSLDAQIAWLITCGDGTDFRKLLGTSDGGDTWKTINESPPYSLGSSILRFASPEEGWIETYNIGAGSALIQVKATHDGGQTWQSIVVEGPHAEIWDSTHLCSICEDSFYYDPLRVILGFGDMGSMTPSGKVSLSTSADLGKTWNDITLPLPAAFSNYLISPGPPTFFNQNDGLLPVQLVTTDGSFSHNLVFYMTSDGGKSWNGGPNVLENFDRCDIKTAFVSPHDIFVGCGNNLYISNDGAKSWRTSSVNPEPGAQAYITQLDFVSADNGWIILTTDTNTTILKMTTDGGKTWTVINPKLERP